MLLKLRILFTILSAICLAVILPALTWFGWWGLGIVGGAALFFFAAMLLCKQAQEKREHENDPPEADFLHPAKSEEKKED